MRRLALAWLVVLASGIAGAKDVDDGDRMISFTTAAPRVFTGPIYDFVPPAPDGPRLLRESYLKLGHLGPDWVDEPVDPTTSDVAETHTGVPFRAPADIVLLRNQQLLPSAGSVSTVAEPSVGSLGNALFETYNWYASISTDNGPTRSFISPYTTFPNTPAPFAAGFCCDQRAAHDSRRDLMFWFLQYIKTSSTVDGTNGLRVAVARGAAGLGNNTWTTYDFTPANLGLTNRWFDFPHMQLSDNFLYFTVNIFAADNNAFSGSAIFRVSLAAMAAGQPATADTFFTTTFGSIMTLHGAAPEGNRPGRTTMVFGALSGANAVRVIRWPESASQPTIDTVTGLTSTAGGTFSCPGPDGLNPCGRSDARLQGGWVTDNEIGMMWGSNSIPPNRPFPFVRVVLLNPTTLSVISEPDIFSTTSAFLYPIAAVGQRGGIGGVVDNMGGDIFPTVRAFIRDDLSPNPVTSGWELVTIAAGDAGSGTWGDYNGVVPHEAFPNTYLGVGRIRVGSPAATQRIRSFWFGRERDARPTLNVGFSGLGTGTVSSSPAGVNCTASCNVLFDVGTTVTLTASANSGSTFLGWRGGLCNGTGPCVVQMTEARGVIAEFDNGQLVFRNGFEAQN